MGADRGLATRSAACLWWAHVRRSTLARPMSSTLWRPEKREPVFRLNAREKSTRFGAWRDRRPRTHAGMPAAAPWPKPKNRPH